MAALIVSKPDEDAPHPGRGRLEEARPQHRVDRAGALEDAVHPAHPVEQGGREPRVAEQVVVEEVDVPAGHPVDLRQRPVDRLRVERDPACVERVLVAEVAMVGAAARDHDRVRAEVATPVDEVAADRWRLRERPRPGDVARRGLAAAQVREEHWPGVLAGTDEDRVGVGGRLVRARRDVETAEDDPHAAGPIAVGDRVGPLRRRDVDRHHDEVRVVVERQTLDVLVLELGLVVGIEVAGERGEPERREQGVLDRPEARIRRLQQRGQDELDLHRGASRWAPLPQAAVGASLDRDEARTRRCDARRVAELDRTGRWVFNHHIVL